jgi:hypothetical protein
MSAVALCRLIAFLAGRTAFGMSRGGLFMGGLAVYLCRSYGRQSQRGDDSGQEKGFQDTHGGNYRLNSAPVKSRGGELKAACLLLT